MLNPSLRNGYEHVAQDGFSAKHFPLLLTAGVCFLNFRAALGKMEREGMKIRAELCSGTDLT